jgi:hypothetical protein
MIGTKINILKKKTFWVGVATIGVGVYEIATGSGSGGIEKILLGLGMITGRQAIEKLEK